MTLRALWDLVEVPTKLASALPFLVGSLWALRERGRWEVPRLVLMALSLFAIDMAVTLINHWTDFRRHHGENDSRNPLVRHRIPETRAALVLVALGVVGVGCGLWLSAQAGIWVLLLGTTGVVVGVLYSFGPLPISHTPLGEAASGLTMGGIIPLVSAMVHFPQDFFLAARWNEEWLSLHVRWRELAPLAAYAWPLVFAIAALMLANNLRDLQRDRQAGRRTLAVVLGRGAASGVMVGLAVLTYLGPFLALGFALVSPYLSIVFVTAPLALTCWGRFLRRQRDPDAFGAAVVGLAAVGLGLILSLIVEIIVMGPNPWPGR